jgi:transposase
VAALKVCRPNYRLVSKALEREVRELRQANEILRKASAYFAMAELDRRSKP